VREVRASHIFILSIHLGVIADLHHVRIEYNGLGCIVDLGYHSLKHKGSIGGGNIVKGSFIRLSLRFRM
jgi:hypothetical protein